MKKFCFVLMVVGFLCFLVTPASALPTPFLDYDGTDVYLNEYSHNSHTWYFDLDNDVLQIGDIDPNDIINYAVLRIDFHDDSADDSDNRSYKLEYTDLYLDGTKVWNDQEVDDWNGWFDVTSTVADHELWVTLNDIKNKDEQAGDFWVKSVSVGGVYTAVPEPGTIVLMGLGLVGLAGMGRKKLFKK